MRRAPVPAYYRIYQTLRDRIATGAYKIGGKLPTDSEIMAEFGVSRHTARSAVEELVAQHLVRRFPGRGSFVQEHDPAWSGWSAQTLEDLHINDPKARFELHEIADMPAEEAARIALRLQVPAGEPILRVSWSRVRPNGPIAYCTGHFPPALARKMPKDLQDLLHTTRLVPLVEKYGGVPAFRVEQVLSAIAADAVLAMRLDVERGTPLLLMQRTYFDAAGNILYYSEICVRSDRLLPKIELFRPREGGR